MYLLHFSTVRQNAFIVQTRYSLDLGFVFLTSLLQLVPHVLDRVASGDPSTDERHQFNEENCDPPPLLPPLQSISICFFYVIYLKNAVGTTVSSWHCLFNFITDTTASTYLKVLPSLWAGISNTSRQDMQDGI